MNKKLSAISSQRSAKPVVMLSLSKHLVVRGRARPPGAPRHYLVADGPAVRPYLWLAVILASIVLPTIAFAVSVISTIDGGGQRATSASYTMDGSVGGIGGISTVASPPETMKHGYIGQLYDVASLAVTGMPASVNETSTSQLSGTATLDDDTVAVLTGSDVMWSLPSFPIAGIDASGVATASVVYANTLGNVNGSYLGVPGSGWLLVLDSDSDNYGSYAGDGLPDWWQNQYFGLNNPSAAPTNDVTGTGQNNLFKYTAGLDPTNPASVFILKIASVTGQPTQKNLIFNPLATGRTYTTQFTTNLVGTTYATLTGIGGPTTNSAEVTVTDLNAVEKQKFYRIKITLP